MLRLLTPGPLTKDHLLIIRPPGPFGKIKMLQLQHFLKSFLFLIFSCLWPIMDERNRTCSTACCTCTFCQSNEPKVMSETVEITRYPNRRLYDRNQKKYVTLGEIEAMILGGQNVRVRDSKSEEDLTRVILVQILIERHPERMKLFPVNFLHEILRADQLSLDWLTVYFGQAKTLMDGLAVPGSTPFVPGMDVWQAFMSAPPRPNASPPAADTPKSDTGEPESRQQMADRLAELERRLEQLEKDS